MLDSATVRYISRCNKKEIATYLKSAYGGSMKSHYDWLDHVSKDFKAQHDKRRIWRNCTIARLDKDFGR